MFKVQAKREETVRPLKARGTELLNKLEVVRSQLRCTVELREKSISFSSLGPSKKSDGELENCHECEEPPPYKISS